MVVRLCWLDFAVSPRWASVSATSVATSQMLAYRHVLSFQLNEYPSCLVVHCGARADLDIVEILPWSLSIIGIRGLEYYDIAIHSSVNVTKPAVTFKRMVYLGSQFGSLTGPVLGDCDSTLWYVHLGEGQFTSWPLNGEKRIPVSLSSKIRSPVN
jgi:hypothetical protein